MDLLFYFDLLLKHEDFHELLINSTKAVLLISDSCTKLFDNRFHSIEELRLAIQKFCYSQKLRLDPKLPSCGGPAGIWRSLFFCSGS